MLYNWEVTFVQAYVLDFNSFSRKGNLLISLQFKTTTVYVSHSQNVVKTNKHVIYTFYGNQARYCQSSNKMSATNT